MTLAFSRSNRTADHRIITGWEGRLAPALLLSRFHEKERGQASLPNLLFCVVVVQLV